MKRVILTICILCVGAIVASGLYQTAATELSKFQVPQPPQTVECKGADRRVIKLTKAYCTQYQLVLDSLRVAPAPAISPAPNHIIEANIPHVPQNQTFGVTLLGTSHGRIFSRNTNHQTVSAILDRTMINLSQGGDRAGLMNQQTYLRYFYARGNTAPVVVYFLDPYVFFNAGMDRNLKLYDGEPFDLGFYEVLLQHPPTNEEILARYGNRRLLAPTLTPSQSYISQNTKLVRTPIDESVMQKRIDSLYTTDYDEAEFEASIQTFLATVELIKSNKGQLIVMVPTTLFSAQKRDAHVIDAMEQLSVQRGFQFYNYAHAITDAKLYSDTDHLNEQGIQTFTSTYILPALNRPVSSTQ